MKKTLFIVLVLLTLNSCTIERGVGEDDSGIDLSSEVADAPIVGDCIVGQWSYISGLEQLQTIMDNITSPDDSIDVQFNGTHGEWLFDIEKSTGDFYNGLYSFNEFGFGFDLNTPVIGAVTVSTNIVGTQPFDIQGTLPSFVMNPGENNLTVTSINSLIDDVVTVSDLPQGFLGVGDISCNDTNLDMHVTMPGGEGTTEYDLSFERVI